jgi:hypothetical protein
MTEADDRTVVKKWPRRERPYVEARAVTVADDRTVVKKRYGRIPRKLRVLAREADMEPVAFLVEVGNHVETQEDLGRALGISRETAFRWLRLCNIRWIRE